MTYSPATVVFLAGVIALISAAVSINGARAAERQGLGPQMSMSKESLRLFNLPRAFVPIFFGVISVAFPDALTESKL